MQNVLNPLNLFTALVFAFVLALLFAAKGLSRRERRRAEAAARLAALMAQTESDAEAAHRVAYPAESVLLGADDYDGPFKGIREKWLRVMKNVEMLGWKRNLRVRLLLTALAGFAAAAAVGRMTDHALLVTLAGGLVLTALLAGAAYLRGMSRWLEDLAKSLPEAIDSIARICRAGVPAQTAFGLAAQNLRGALADELKQMDRWLRLGVPMKQVLQESARRVPLAEYRFFAVILIISQESGGRLADTLERLAATLREREELRLKVQAKTSEARASIKIVACLVPGVLAYQYVQAPGDFHFLVTDPVGLRVIGYAVASVALGLFVTWVMVRRIQ